MENAKVDRSYQGLKALEKLGENIIFGIEPEVLNFDGTIPEMKNNLGQYDEKAHLEMTIPYDADHHIDIFSEGFTITYPIEKDTEVNTVFISGFYSGNGDYLIGEFELFFSNDKASLYNEENRAAYVNNEGVVAEFNRKRCAEMFINVGAIKAKYFGIKVNKPCAQDDICRIGNIELYNEERTKQIKFCIDNFQTNQLTAENINIGGLDTSVLCDGEVFDGKTVKTKKIVLNSDILFESVGIVGFFDDFDIYMSDDEASLFEGEKLSVEIDEIDTDIEERAVNVNLGGLSKKYVGIVFSEEAELEEVGAYTSHRYVNADLDTVRTADFVGIGGNELPMYLMPESRMDGFRDVYWPLYENRIIKSQPAALRVWFQVDWVVDNEADYKEGKCNFSLPKFQSVLKCFDAYEKAGIEVNLNFGWKVSTEIQGWFSLPHIGPHWRGGNGMGASAPKDLDGFANTCASVIKELSINRGYKCLKHLTFYNESGYGDYGLTRADFLGYQGHSLEKWDEMFNKVRNKLIAEGIDDCVDFWLSEISGSDALELEWLDYFSKNYPTINKMNTFHRYALNYDKRLKYFAKVKEASHGVPAMASEFAVYADPTWESSDMEYVMSLLRSGLNGGLYWTYMGVMMTDPTWLGLRGGWVSPAYDPEQINKENDSYHHFSLFTHYMPRHSSVLECTVSDDDIRAEVIRTPDGEYTVFVENKAGVKNKTLHINFGKALNRKFRKHVYRLDCVKDGNMLVPAAEKEFDVTDSLEDVVDKEYCLVAYTSIPEYKQIKMDSIEVYCPVGESIQLGCELIGCEGEVEWTVEYCSGPQCFVDENGVFTQGEGTLGGHIYCVRATLKSDPLTMGTCIVKLGTPDDQDHDSLFRKK